MDKDIFLLKVELLEAKLGETITAIKMLDKNQNKLMLANENRAEETAFHLEDWYKKEGKNG